MPEVRHHIPLTLLYRGERYTVNTYPGAYASLMSLISDELAIPGFGLCCGMGSCGTCLVELTDAGSEYKRPVLSCGARVDVSMANVTIVITDP